jgi:hypothetical protein
MLGGRLIPEQKRKSLFSPVDEEEERQAKKEQEQARKGASKPRT